MLHHRDPAIVGLGYMVGVAFVDIAKRNLLEFFQIGIDHRAGIGAVLEHRVIAQHGIISYQLQIQRWCNSRATADRKSVVWGKSVSDGVDLGGSRIIKKKKQ